MIVRVIATALLLAPSSWAGEIRGHVLNSRGGEPLDRVRVSLVEAECAIITSADGSFSINDLAPGKYTLRVDAVGFWLQRVEFSLGPEDVKEFSIALVPTTGRHTETVEVRGDTFLGPEPANVAQLNLTPVELKETATVLASDPFRSLQTLPGVTAAGNNDLFAQFNVFGAPFDSIAVYLDDVRVRQPFHGISERTDGASIGIMSTDVVESLTLTPVAFPARYGDGIGGALDMRTREGSRTKPIVRIAAGVAESHGTAEGGLDDGRGSWLLSLRRSYMGYLTHHAVNEDYVDVGFYDAESKLTYDLSKRQSVDLFALYGKSGVNRSAIASQLDVNSLVTGDNEITLARTGWRFAATEDLLLSARAAFFQNDYVVRNPGGAPLSRTNYGEWTGGSTVVWSWKPDQVMEAGYDFHRIRDFHQSNWYGDPPSFSVRQNTGLQQGGYVQQSSKIMGRLQIMGGLRWDHMNLVGLQPLSPQLSGSLRIASGTQLQFGLGRYTQFPDPSLQEGTCGGFGPMLSRSNHYMLGLEQRIGASIRLRVEGYERDDRSEDGVHGGDAALAGFPILTDCGPIQRSKKLAMPMYHGHARGVQFVLQRRSSNRLSGWIGYTLGYARVDAVEQFGIGSYPSSLDQRHTVNAFASYRLRPSVSMGGKFLYGSAYPLPGLYTRVGDIIYQGIPSDCAMLRDCLSASNSVRMDPYLRLDFRVDKSLTFRQRKLTLYSELLNATNHRNMRILGADYLEPVIGLWRLHLIRTFGVTPTAGLAIEF